MPLIEQKITIQRPIFDVFRLATDFERMREWQPDLLEVSLTSANPVRSGTMISMRRRFMGRLISLNADVLDFQRSKSLEIQGVHGTFPFRRTIEFSSSARETVISDRYNVRAGWFYFWYTPFFSRALKAQTDAEWKKLKQFLESGGM